MSDFKLKWKGDQLTSTIAGQLIAALDEIDLRIEGTAKEQLYPGHGKRSGVLQRAIQHTPAHRQGNRIIGGVGTKGAPYAAVQHRRYRYLTIGLQRWRGSALTIVRKHTGG